MRFWDLFRSAGSSDGILSPEEFDARCDELIRRTPPPTFWLLGKTGSGKSSLVRYLTGAGDVEIGRGFRPCTRYSRQYDYPSPQNPLLRFLDTRGLGELDYDPTEDVERFHDAAHALIVTVRLLDSAQEAVVVPLRRTRRDRPDRPVLLAVTCLHDAYPQTPHPPYPFSESLDPPLLPEAVRRPLVEHRRRFEGVVDAVVPIDLTRPEDGFTPTDYGGDLLRTTLHDLLPEAYRTALRQVRETVAGLKDLHRRQAMPHVLGAARLAAVASGASWIPYADIPIVVGIQMRMVARIAAIYRQEVGMTTFLQMAAAAGGGFVVRQALRSSLKWIPLAGTAAGNLLAMPLAYAYTYALGQACCWYFAELRAGHEPSTSELARVLREAHAEADSLFRFGKIRENRP